MIDRFPVKRWVILGSLVSGILVAASVICAAAVGLIPPEPALSLIAIVCGSIVCIVAAWRFASRPPP